MKRPHYSSKHIGRGRYLLADRLIAAGVQVFAEDIGCATGANRTNKVKDRDDTILCWGAEGIDSQGHRVRLVSYSTITACLRYGFTMGMADGLLWVDANEVKP